MFETREITRKVVVEYSKHFSGLFKDMGIHGFTFHNLRHTFASIMQSELGIGAVTVMGMTGHSLGCFKNIRIPVLIAKSLMNQYLQGFQGILVL